MNEINQNDEEQINGEFDQILVRRCSAILYESRSHYKLNLETVFQNDSGVLSENQWVAYTAHLDSPLEISESEFKILERMNDVQFKTVLFLRLSFDLIDVESLIKKGLLLIKGSQLEKNDLMFKDFGWNRLAAIYFSNSRWKDKELPNQGEVREYFRLQKSLGSYGKPPGFIRENDSRFGEKINLPMVNSSPANALLRRRFTCRKFSQVNRLSLETIAQILGSTFGARNFRTLSNGLEIVSKNSPAGGSIHATECYVVIKSHTVLDAGVYWYDSMNHCLVKEVSMRNDEVSTFSISILPGQEYFSEAQVLLILTSRFDRLNWKYRNHDKAYRVSLLDAGHLAQSLHTFCAESELGSFISGAINDIEIEKTLKLDPLKEGVVAVCGFGHFHEDR